MVEFLPVVSAAEKNVSAFRLFFFPSLTFEDVRCVLAPFSVGISVSVRLPVILEECSNVRNASAEQGFSLQRCPRLHRQHFVSAAPGNHMIPSGSLLRHSGKPGKVPF